MMSYITVSFIVLMIILIEADALRSSSTSSLFLFPRPVIKNNNNNSNQNNQLLSRRRAIASIETTSTTRVNALCSLTATGRDKRGVGSNATSIINITRKSATGAPVVDSALLRFMSQQRKISDAVIYDGVDVDTSTTDKRKSASGAPVVDSALLRFISQQKKIPGTFFSVEDVSVEKRSVVVKPMSMPSSSFSASALPTNYQLRNVTSSFAFGDEEDDGAEEQEEEWVVKNTMLNAEEETTTTTTSSIQSKPSPSPSSSPLPSSSSSPTTVLQYSSKNIEQTLIQNAIKGTDELSDPITAKLAGDAIERYCIVRSARKNIRRFLKERDNLWSGAGAGGSSSDDNGNDSSSASSRHELETLAAFAAASSPAASLLLSYAEQQKGGATDQEDSSFTFQDVIDVMKEYGLTINDICVLFTHSPNLALRVPRKSFLRIASKQEHATLDSDVDVDVENHDHEHVHDDVDHDESLEETLERSLQGLLQTTLGLRRYDARKVLRQCPTLVTVRGSKSAVQILTMMTSMGVSTSSLKRDKAGLPTLLSRSPAGVFRLISFLSSTAARMPLKQIGPLLRRKIGQQLLDAVTPVPPLTISLGTTTTTTTPEIDEIEIDRREVWYRNRAERKIQIERTYGEMTRTALLLQKQLGTQNLSKVIAAYPQVLLLDGEKQILPVARYLMGGLGIWKDDLSSLVQLYPTIFGKTIDELETIVSYLVDELGVDEDDLGHIFRSFPVLFTLDIHQDIEPVVSYLKTHCNVKDIGSFVTRLPPVLGYSVEKEIQPKWEFLKKMTLKPEYELNSFPAYFSYPFQRVIKTRFNYLASKNIFWFSSNCIDSVLRYGDIDFATKIALDDDEGVAYKAFGSQSSLRSCNKSSLQNDVRDRIEQPWRTTKRREMKHRRPSIQSQYQRIEGQSPPRTFRDSKKYLRREKAIAAAAAAKSASGSSDEHLTKSQRSKAKAKKKAEKKAAEKEKANSIQGKTTSAMYNPLLTLAQQKKLLKNISLA